MASNTFDINLVVFFKLYPKIFEYCVLHIIFSLGLCFACLFVLFDLFLSHSFVFPWAVKSSPLQFLALA